MATHTRKVAVERDDDHNEILQGKDLVGREINLVWEDGNRYNAVVVRYYDKDNEYKLVYTTDDGVEVANIDDRDWYLLNKRYSTEDKPILIGSIIKFIYPKDGKMYRAMIYHNNPTGEQLRVCYLDEHSTDAIGGYGWSFITKSPCAHTNYELHLQQQRQAKQHAEGVQGDGDDGADDDEGDGEGEGHDEAGVMENDDEDSSVPPPPPPPPTTVSQQYALANGRAGSSRGTSADGALDVRRGRVAKKPWVK